MQDCHVLHITRHDDDDDLSVSGRSERGCGGLEFACVTGTGALEVLFSVKLSYFIYIYGKILNDSRIYMKIPMV